MKYLLIKYENIFNANKDTSINECKRIAEFLEVNKNNFDKDIAYLRIYNTDYNTRQHNKYMINFDKVIKLIEVMKKKY